MVLVLLLNGKYSSNRFMVSIPIPHFRLDKKWNDLYSHILSKYLHIIFFRLSLIENIFDFKILLIVNNFFCCISSILEYQPYLCYL
jgi:hypothetical protein